jgi:ribonuclease R
MGERTRKRFRLGDRLHVEVVRVDLDTSRIDFILA